MSPDEIFVAILCGILALTLWFRWFRHALAIVHFGRSPFGRGLAVFAAVLSWGIVFAALRTIAAHDVRDDGRYLALYALMGAAWVGGATRMFPLLGLSPRDDVFERGNGAAALATAGGVIGLTFAFIGGNVGDGPGWFVVVFSAGLATAALLVVWLVLEMLASVSDVVTVDRDAAAGLRLGGFLMACGAVFGRAAAGDWVSTDATLRDFVTVAQPALLILIAAVAIEYMARPTPERPVRDLFVWGLVPAGLYAAVAVMHLLELGPW